MCFCFDPYSLTSVFYFCYVVGIIVVSSVNYYLAEARGQLMEISSMLLQLDQSANAAAAAAAAASVATSSNVSTAAASHSTHTPEQQELMMRISDSSSL